MKRALWVTTVISLGLLVLVLLDAHVSFLLTHRHDPYRWGVSYSAKYARELGVDGKAVMTGALDELEIRHFRLMSYWDELEPQDGSYAFEDLDWQMNEVAKRGGKVSLAIGLRQPRYPECHRPDWTKDMTDSQLEQQLLEYMTVVVSRYRGHLALESYQLENEAMNRSFGHCTNFDRARLVREFDLVKSLDPHHPVIVSVSNQVGLPLGQPRGDQVGFSVYRMVYQYGLNIYTPHLATSLWHRTRAALVERYLGRTVIIHELQAEPWGPRGTQELSVEEQARSMDSARMRSTIGFAKYSGIHQADLWGLEWWYWRKTLGDGSLWNTARAIYAESH
jgi:hypothetical protein